MAVFFDKDAFEGRSTFQLTLHCGGSSFYACSGVCVDAAIEARNCGSCGNTCEGDCNGGSCDVAWSACFDLPASTFDDCAAYCGSVGEVCADDCESVQFSFNTFVRFTLPSCQGTADYDFENDRCDDGYTWSDSNGSFSSAQCCCSSGAVFP